METKQHIPVKSPPQPPSLQVEYAWMCLSPGSEASAIFSLIEAYLESVNNLVKVDLKPTLTRRFGNTRPHGASILEFRITAILMNDKY
jgi:hypothetical protein